MHAGPSPQALATMINIFGNLKGLIVFGIAATIWFVWRACSRR
jgi:hypothetical protein